MPAALTTLVLAMFSIDLATPVSEVTGSALPASLLRGQAKSFPSLTQIWGVNPNIGPSRAWTVHGLWPDLCNGNYSGNCAPDRELSNITAILRQNGQRSLLKVMNKYWLSNNGTNENFWEHEYNKHGTCISTLEPKCSKKTHKEPFPEVTAYFSKTMELYKKLPTYKWLKAKGITPSTTRTYNLTQIHDAIVSKTGFIPSVRCVNGYISEIWYYYLVQGSVSNGKFTHSAPDASKDTCPDVGIKYVPKGTMIPSV
ncbi:ribonuclease T2 family [Ceratobasidium sp. AG-Ba]|nr:ribonuclease T2 family [Ceratobasidium sp. AG-Ba]